MQEWVVIVMIITMLLMYPCGRLCHYMLGRLLSLYDDAVSGEDEALV